MIKPIFFTKFSQSRSGFTLIEVLTGMVISAMTISMSANLVVTANIYKVVAKKNVAMQTLIQADLEQVRNKAKFLLKDDSKCSNKLPTGTLYTGSNYANALKDSLDAVAAPVEDSRANEKYKLVRTIPTPTDHNVLRLQYNVQREITRGSGVYSNNLDYSVYTEVIPDVVFQCS
jgi:prepilin-type N-terminal cleavage/methylation domain-containing protein